MKAYLAWQLFGREASIPLFNQIDPVLHEALKYWDRAEALAAYFAPKADDTVRKGR